MKNAIDLPDDIAVRIDRLAERTSLSRSQIIENALSHGHSLAWQEKWTRGIEAGIVDANDGNFASQAEMDALLNRYGQA